MKANIFKITAIVLVLAGSSFSCEKDPDTYIDELSGMYIQTYPEYPDELPIRINFIDRERLEIIRGDIAEEFIYDIQGNSIKLTTLTHDPEMTDELYFRIINSSKFEIENLDYHVLSADEIPPNMIFEKEN